LPAVGGQVERFVGEGELADDRVVEAFDAGAVELDVVGGPPHAELVAAGGELADEVGQTSVVGVAAGFGAQDGDGVVGDGVPVDEELRRAWVEEQEAGRVRWLDRVVEDVGVEGVAETVGGEDVQATVADVRRGAGHRVEDLLHRRADAFLGRSSPWRPVR
jgi:hypothetical protein